MIELSDLSLKNENSLVLSQASRLTNRSTALAKRRSLGDGSLPVESEGGVHPYGFILLFNNKKFN